MSEQENLQKEEEIPEQEQQEQHEERNEVEVQARGKGWRPKEEYEGDPSDWVDADEFVKREPLYKAIHKANRETKRIKQQNDHIKKMLKDVQENAKKQALSELQKAYAQAAENNDVKTAVETHSKIVQLEKQDETELKDDANVIFEEWVEANSWYNEDKALRREATALGYGLNAADPDMPMEELYAEVERLIKERHPDKFGMKKKVSSVTQSTTRTTTTKPQKNGKGLSSLPEEVQQIAKLSIKSKYNPNGVFDSEEEYVEAYIAGGGQLRGA